MQITDLSIVVISHVRPKYTTTTLIIVLIVINILTCSDDKKQQKNDLQYDGCNDDIFHSSDVNFTADPRSCVAIINIVSIKVVLHYQIYQTCKVTQHIYN